jgi:predicted transglutaminase-like cysteine proteinase
MARSRYMIVTAMSIALIVNSPIFALAKGPRALTPLTVESANTADGALQGGGAKIRFGQATAIPDGYYEMCVNYPAFCRLRRGWLPSLRDGSVRLNRKMLDQLASVNLDVNAAIRPVYRDGWLPGRDAGDCKDYALTKRQRLIDVGWPSSALPVAIVRTFLGEQHLVLVARTSDGDFILDNLRQDIVSWTQARYSWEKIQSTTNMWVWNTI